MKHISNTIDLGEVVESELAANGEDPETTCSETYGETARRVGVENPDLAEFLRLAERRWFEIEEG